MRDEYDLGSAVVCDWHKNFQIVKAVLSARPCFLRIKSTQLPADSGHFAGLETKCV